MTAKPETYKPARDRRKPAPVKRITISPEARQAYEDNMRERDRRDAEHTRFLPEEHKRRR